MRTLHEIYIVKNEDFTAYEIISPIELIEVYNNVLVFINNNELNVDIDYTLSDGVLYFTNHLAVGDKIIIKASILDNVKLITKNSYSKDSLFKVFSSNIKFKSNHKYDFTLSVGDEIFSSSFLTKFDPFYTTVKIIRTDTGDLLNGVSDEQISRVIYSNSKYVLEKLELLDEMPEKLPTYAKNYARYKTDIDFCYSIYLSMSGRIGSFSKKIGDIQIDTTYKLPYLSDMLSRFKELLLPNQDLVNNGSGLSASTSFIRAKGSEYPVTNRGVF